MITHDELRRIAALSRLNVSDAELDKLAADMTEIVAFADRVSAANVDPAPPDEGFELSALREDVLRNESVAAPDRAALLSNAQTSDGAFFALDTRARQD
jgi:aspartyl/glutamyl-tRNA(Asn/Gln) amidotransferase C subunit